jgi:hypothetical protein
MVDYDKRFNFQVPGERKMDLYTFPVSTRRQARIFLKGVKSVKLIFSPSISPVVEGRRPEFMWDVA